MSSTYMYKRGVTSEREEGLAGGRDLIRRIPAYTRDVQMNFALGYLAGAHFRFHLLVFKSDPLDECEYTL